MWWYVAGILVLLWACIACAIHSEYVSRVILFGGSGGVGGDAAPVRRANDTVVLYFHGLGEERRQPDHLPRDVDLYWFTYDALADNVERAKAAYLEIKQSWRNVIFYGRSMGTYFAVKVAAYAAASAAATPGGRSVVLLEVPMLSLHDTINKMLGKFAVLVPGSPHRGDYETTYDDLRALGSVSAISTRNDEVVTFDPNLPLKRHVIVSCLHNDVYATAEWQDWFRAGVNEVRGVVVPPPQPKV